ncbi:uncharacterized protein LOC106082737 [Stomoxys calcitrans]|uniref:MD-2-related lipid-recognition domain-containing protein n=1 Tax=Stomoxys calcitrans TaxID=35570 RepID=A0A1I8P2H1_STOCA|nr:uncharacterized protein LOC106082737 [Stomoxys calcitrans]
MFLKTVLNLAIFAVILEVAFACNGYKIKILKAENCVEDPVITIDPESTLKLNKKCELIPTGCIVNKGFKTAVSKFKATKDGIVVKEGKMDWCTMAKQVPEEVKSYAKVFGAPTSCPVEESKICSDDKRIDISNYKSFLALARGNLVIDSNVEHDTGKSCFHIELEISK